MEASVGTDPVDHYRFSFTTGGRQRVQLGGLTRDVDIYVLDSAGNTIASGRNSSTTSEDFYISAVPNREYFPSNRSLRFFDRPSATYQLATVCSVMRLESQAIPMIFASSQWTWYGYFKLSPGTTDVLVESTSPIEAQVRVMKR